jgi:hypothetical protein
MTPFTQMGHQALSFQSLFSQPYAILESYLAKPGHAARGHDPAPKSVSWSCTGHHESELKEAISMAEKKGKGDSKPKKEKKKKGKKDKKKK